MTKIIENKLAGVSSKPKPYEKYLAPKPLNENLPKLWFCAMLVSSKGKGKTFSCVNLLQNYSDTGIVDPYDNERGKHGELATTIKIEKNQHRQYVFIILREREE